MIDIVLSDLDSTVADTRGRAHLAVSGPTSHEAWIPYSQACESDVPMLGTITALQLLSEKYPIFLISGRNVEAEKPTMNWLKKHSVPYKSLRLRTAQDIQHNGAYKVAYIERLRAIGYNPVLMFEDHIGVGEMVEAIGVPVITVHPRYEDSVGVNFNNLAEDKPSFVSFLESAPVSEALAYSPRHARR